MVSALRHRGPESSGVLEDRGVILGHTRLSIIDLSTGDQPMSTPDQRLWIVFNGEIFNYLELKRELIELGHVFATKSDTEVILAAFRQWGTDCFVRLNGQWALAIWDREKQNLLLSRDPVGIRPLYYSWIGRTPVFASEVKALFQCSGLERRLSPEGVGQVFTLWGPVAPATAFNRVFQLEPGHWVEVDGRTAETRSGRYWAPSFRQDAPARDATLAENIERFREALIRAVRLRFDRSDVPVGAYLSGGIDSSVTTAILARHTSVPLTTFSLVFADDEFDESAYQQVVADRLGTHHESIVVTAADIGAVFPDVVYHGEQPILRTAPAPLYLLSRLVHDSGYKVVVTGEGADEMLGGYDLFREAMARSFVAAAPGSALRKEIVLRLYPWMRRSPANAPAFAKAFFSQGTDPSDPGFSHRPRWNTSTALFRLLRPEFRAAGPDSVMKHFLSDLPGEFRSWHLLERAQYLEIASLLSSYILSAQGDRMLMANSVEGRFPFLDLDLMALAGELPPRHKVMGLDEKHILKRAFGDLVPREVVERPKQPYRAPDAASFFLNGDEPDWLNEVLREGAVEEAGIFNAKMVSGLVRKCRAAGGTGMSNTDNMRLVAVVSTMLLHHLFITNFRVSSAESDVNFQLYHVSRNN